MNDAVLAQVQLCKLAVGISQFKGNRAGRFRPATPDFRQGEFEPVRQIDPRSRFRAGDGIQNWLAVQFHVVDSLEGGTIAQIPAEDSVS